MLIVLFKDKVGYSVWLFFWVLTETEMKYIKFEETLLNYRFLSGKIDQK